MAHMVWTALEARKLKRDCLTTPEPGKKEHPPKSSQTHIPICWSLVSIFFPASQLGASLVKPDCDPWKGAIFGVVGRQGAKRRYLAEA